MVPRTGGAPSLKCSAFGNKAFQRAWLYWSRRIFSLHESPAFRKAYSNRDAPMI